WSGIGPTWGQSWLDDLSLLVPGAGQSSFASQLHSVSGGSREGNAPLFFAADAWFASGWIGVPIISVLFVFLYAALDSLLYQRRTPYKDSARAFMFFNIPLIYSPY